MPMLITPTTNQPLEINRNRDDFSSEGGKSVAFQRLIGLFLPILPLCMLFYASLDLKLLFLYLNVALVCLNSA